MSLKKFDRRRPQIGVRQILRDHEEEVAETVREIREMLDEPGLTGRGLRSLGRMIVGEMSGPYIGSLDHLDHDADHFHGNALSH